SSVLIQTESGVLITDTLVIEAWVENPQASLTPDSVLTEYSLDIRSLTIDLSEEKFKSFAGLLTNDFTLVDVPSGTSIQSVLGISDTKVEIELRYNGLDFDTDHENFHVDIDSSVLIQTETLVLSTDTDTIFAYVEIPVATMSADSMLREWNLDANRLTIDFTEETFLDHNNLEVSNFTLVNAPVGLGIESVSGVSPTQVQLDLVYTGLDFDVTVTDFAVDIIDTVLLQTTSGALRTDSLMIIAYIEDPVSTIVADSSVLNEQRLDYRSLVVTFDEERFFDYLTLNPLNFSLSGAPTGTGIQSITGNSPTQATILLQFDDTDFDVDYNDFRLVIDNSELIQTGSGTLVSNPLSIIAWV
ncbi:hypothetical protein LCGC14_3040250, partial [marine sediment metagenome]